MEIERNGVKPVSGYKALEHEISHGLESRYGPVDVICCQLAHYSPGLGDSGGLIIHSAIYAGK